jgi:tagatose 1,6-diphosphate aldolase GatY/KbaY
LTNSFVGMLEEARRRGTAVGAFTCYDAETAVGVLQAAAGRPVILLVSSQLVRDPAGPLVVAALQGMARHASSPVCLQLDHAHDLDVIRTACELGMDAVMADGSHLPFEANAEFVVAARAIAAPLGIAVEAEIGHLEGDEEIAVAADSGPATDPAEAERFAHETGADCLAVAIGNVHGIYRARPRLDVACLREIAHRVDVPLALHGGSGIPPAQLFRCVEAGIAKINVNTELRQAYLARTERDLPAALDGAGLLSLHRSQVGAVAAVVAEKLASVPPPAPLSAPRALGS